MKQIPILYNTAMVKAILNGSKTETRRPVKGAALQWLEEGFTPEFVAHPENHLSPYGYEGDMLWVRETWQEVREVTSGKNKGQYYLRGQIHPSGQSYSAPWYEYLAGPIKGEDEPPKWRPSIHMPREASRITLLNTGTRIERLQEISQEGAMREGVTNPMPHRCPEHWEDSAKQPIDCHRCAFKVLWNRIYGPRALGWDKNPWVWVVKQELTGE